jgi:glucosamine kinase
MGILIADSGSTKTDWREITGDGRILSYKTAGLNPFYQSVDEISQILIRSLIPSMQAKIDRVYFYGAGCLGEKSQKIMRDALGKFFSVKGIHISDDLMAAARSSFGDQPGIACILGTGSNSGLYNGIEIVDKIPAMGFILGDEGSGAVMGRKLVNAYFKREMPSELEFLFLEKYKLTLEELLLKTYKEAFPNRYLANFTYFLKENLENPWVHQFVAGVFKEFVEKNIVKYPAFRDYPVSFTGSLGYAFKDILQKLLLEFEIQCGTIQDKPVEALVNYHLDFDRN